MELIYLVSGVLAIALIVGAIARDSIALIGDGYGPTQRELPRPSAFDRPLYLAGLVALLALWLGAAWLR